MLTNTLCVKMRLWEDQFTNCFSQLLSRELSSLSTIEAFVIGKLERIATCAVTPVHVKQHSEKQQTRFAGLSYALRKINM